jgi:hypothetical protein
MGAKPPEKNGSYGLMGLALLSNSVRPERFAAGRIGIVPLASRSPTVTRLPSGSTPSSGSRAYAS